MLFLHHDCVCLCALYRLVSKVELTEYVKNVGGNSALVEKLVEALDADGDGQISKAEFKALAF